MDYDEKPNQPYGYHDSLILSFQTGIFSNSLEVAIVIPFSKGVIHSNLANIGLFQS